MKVNCEQDLQTITRLGSTGRVDNTTADAYLSVQEALGKGNAKQAVKRLQNMLEESKELNGASRQYLEAKLKEFRAGFLLFSMGVLAFHQDLAYEGKALARAVEWQTDLGLSSV
eukprot:UN2998